jgi:hypothetical protein
MENCPGTAVPNLPAGHRIPIVKAVGRTYLDAPCTGQGLSTSSETGYDPATTEAADPCLDAHSVTSPNLYFSSKLSKLLQLQPKCLAFVVRVF